MERKFVDLIENLSVKKCSNFLETITVNSVEHNSKNVKPGCVFVCLKGEKSDGNNYVGEAIKNGASVVVSNVVPQQNIPYVVCENTRNAYAIISKNFFYKACDKLKIISVVGTNGKTSCTYFIKSILEADGHLVGVIGTHEIIYKGKSYKNDLTTPDPFMLHSVLFDMQNCGITHVVMEVSAHAIALNKLDGIISEVALFTNCTQDHLDYFKTMGNYKNTKKSFFSSKYVKKIVVNTDDELGEEIARNNDCEECVSYGIDKPSNCFAISTDEKLKSCSFLANLFDDLIDVTINFGGEHNIFNALGSASVCKLLGVKDESVKKGLKSLTKIPGRYDFIPNNLGFEIVIDYAHTPNALEKIIQAVQSQIDGHIICVFGATGNRDKLKRPIMGKILNTCCDRIILTNDSPDNENALDIAKDVLKGIKFKEKVNILLSREEAVNYALSIAKPCDAVLILGKGMEDYQIVNGKKEHYSDYESVSKFLFKMGEK